MSISGFHKNKVLEFIKARSKGLVVKAEDSQPRGCGIESLLTGYTLGNENKGGYFIEI